MNSLIIKYGVSDTRRYVVGIVASYLLILCSYLAVANYLASRPVVSALFYFLLLGAILSLVIILISMVFSPTTFLKIDNEIVDINIQKNKKRMIEWVDVSQINIGVSYVVFFVNGGLKQKKIDLTELKYKDVLQVKAKIIELSEFKNIPYTND